jgi:hypothetical protein
MPAFLSAAALFVLGLIVLAVAGFWPTYLNQPFAKLDRYTHAHAALGAFWLLLLLGQILLIRSGRRGVHRQVGRLSYVAAPFFILSSVLLAHFRFSRMDEPTFAKEAYTLYLPLSVSLLFVCAYGLALLHRRQVRLHGSFMLCTALLLVDPVVGRVLAFHVIRLPEFWHYQLITFALEFGVLFALLRGLPRHSPDRSQFAPFAALFVLVQLLWFVAPRTVAWTSIADWFRRLPLT